VTTRDTDRARETTSDSRWACVVRRDPESDAVFYYSVATTGVYCRPSCGARLARPEHVRFYETCEAAERAGFRPCKRCKPNEQPLLQKHTRTIADSCRLIEASEDRPDLKKLAHRAGLSPYHFHRLFKAIIGVTPRQYAAAHRAKRIRSELTKNATVTQAIYEAGYNSNGRFYEESSQLLGMTPSDYRAGGARAKICFAAGECSLGSILVARSDRGICAILLGDNPELLLRDLEDRFPQADLVAGDIVFETLIAKVIALIEAPGLGLDLPLDIRGTAFQQLVWKALRNVPAGETVSYSEIARRIGSPRSVRAVAQACGANPLAVAIPCHRVVRNDGALSGYRWGIERKRVLLNREARFQPDARPAISE
jgi:AraC family transcriptional regulator, regulatory protein of adaptative response / methylated-DNA-[protein]-cysteine methyltransferase